MNWKDWDMGDKWETDDDFPNYEYLWNSSEMGYYIRRKIDQAKILLRSIPSFANIKTQLDFDNAFQQSLEQETIQKLQNL